MNETLKNEVNCHCYKAQRQNKNSYHQIMSVFFSLFLENLSKTTRNCQSAKNGVSFWQLQPSVEIDLGKITSNWINYFPLKLIKVGFRLNNHTHGDISDFRYMYIYLMLIKYELYNYIPIYNIYIYILCTSLHHYVLLNACCSVISTAVNVPKDPTVRHSITQFPNQVHRVDS